MTDPSGEFPVVAAALYGLGYLGYDQADKRVKSGVGRAALDGIGFITGYENIQQDWGIITNSCMDIQCKLLAVGDLALNATYGVSMASGVMSSARSARLALKMRKMTISQRLGHLRKVARASKVTVRPGSMSYRPLGERFVWLDGSALDNSWKLAGKFKHEMRHVGQEFGRFGKLAKPLLRASDAAAKPGEKNLARLTLYLLNPAEGQAFASGLIDPANFGLSFGNVLYTEGILKGVNAGVNHICDER